MKDQITMNQIDKSIKEKYDSRVIDMAKQVIEDMKVTMPEFPVCYIHKGIFQGKYIEYTTKKREVVKICTSCMYKAIDKYLGD